MPSTSDERVGGTATNNFGPGIESIATRRKLLRWFRPKQVAATNEIHSVVATSILTNFQLSKKGGHSSSDTLRNCCSRHETVPMNPIVWTELIVLRVSPTCCALGSAHFGRDSTMSMRLQAGKSARNRNIFQGSWSVSRESS